MPARPVVPGVPNPDRHRVPDSGPDPRPHPGPHPGLSPVPHPVLDALAVLAPPVPRVLTAIGAGAVALGSAVALTAVAAWLISRAAQQPSVVELGLAVVAVRALGISRGVFRYLERLASHDVALRGTVLLREQLYRRLAAADRGVVAGLRRGDLIARVGADADLVGDLLVRGLLPFAVAGVVCVGGVVLVAVVLPVAGAVLAAALVVAFVLAPWLAGTAAARAHRVADESAGEISAMAHGLLDHATELTVAGGVQRHLDDAARSESVRAQALDDATRPAAWAAALSTLAMGAAVLGGLVVGSDAVRDGSMAPVFLALVTLTPMAMVDVVAPLPAAATAVVRATSAMQRLQPLLHARPVLPRPRRPDGAGPTRTAGPGPVLSARDLSCGWPGAEPALSGLRFDLKPGEVVAVRGASGVGKTTLLHTMAGLLQPAAGEVRLDGTPLADLDPTALRRTVTLTSEDAHVFSTTLRDNLLVARGDADDAVLLDTLHQVGLSRWFAGLEDGLDTLLEPGTVSGGEHRRLLVARALLVGSRVMLLDEPAEHLDADAADVLLASRRRHARDEGVCVVVVTHHPRVVAGADRVLHLADGTGTFGPSPEALIGRRMAG